MKVEPTITKAAPETLSELSRRRSGNGKVLTIYLDLEPSRFATPPARLSQLNSLLNEAQHTIEDADLSRAERQSLEQDIARVRDHLGAMGPAEGAMALGVYCSGSTGLFDVVKLPRPVEPRVVVSDGPWLGPLAEILGADEWFVMLINRSSARFFRGTGDALVELGDVQDVVHRKHSQGGWSQARYQRSVEQDVQNHVRRTTEILRRAYEADPFDHLIVGMPDELRPEVEHALHPNLRTRVRGRLHVDVQHSSREQVERAARAVIVGEERRHEREVLDRFQHEMGTGGRAVAGPEDVRKALDEGRVEVLLLADGADGGTIERALGQSAEVMVVRHHDDLAKLGPMAALLRF